MMDTSSNAYYYQNRVDAIRAELAGWEVDGLLIGSATNRRWLSGFSGTAGWLLVTDDRALLGTDFRYWAQATRQAPAFQLFNFRGPQAKIWPSFLNFSEPVRIGVEARHLTLAQFDDLQGIPNVTFVKLDQSLERAREVKSVQELKTIEAAAAITDKIMAEVNHIARPGMREQRLAWELERRMREEGATSMAFPIIVASGPNAAMAHHHPGERALQEGDAIIVDMGAALDGYASDLTRTFFMGSEPDARFRKIYDLVYKAHEAAISGMRAGTTGKEADSLARDTISAGGYGEAFGHSLGHGVGLDVHEGPSLSQLYGDKPLPADAVVTVEPGVYLPEWGGVRIEDLLQVTERGVRFLSQCPKIPAISY